MASPPKRGLSPTFMADLLPTGPLAALVERALLARTLCLEFREAFDLWLDEGQGSVELRGGQAEPAGAVLRPMGFGEGGKVRGR